MKIDPWKRLKERVELKKGTLIFLGEFHGASANVKVIELFSKKLEIKTIMLELEPKWSSSLSSLASGRKRVLIKNLCSEGWLPESGLIGREHLAFLAKHISRGGRVIPIKIEHKDWNTAESRTAGYIDKLIRTENIDSVLLIMGNLHARRKSFIRDHKRFIPVGSLLRNCVSVKIRYASGQAFNFRKLILRDSGALKVLRGRKALLRVSRSRYFDFDYFVSNTKPIDLIQDKIPGRT